MRTRTIVAAILLTGLMVTLAAANSTNSGAASQPPTQGAPQDTVSGEAGAVSPQQVEIYKKREEARKHRDEMMQKRLDAAGDPGGIQSLDQQQK